MLRIIELPVEWSIRHGAMQSKHSVDETSNSRVLVTEAVVVAGNVHTLKLDLLRYPLLVFP
ncbi:MAG: hypothetical protein ABFE08_15660 [Armatimonadia bacterium]